MTARTKLKLAGYPRVSRVGDRDDERLRSPEYQAQLIGGFAAAHGYDVEMFPAELDVSGAKPSRVILDRIIGRIEAGELDGVVVARLNRLSRLGPRDRLELFERIEAAGGVVLSATEPNDMTTPEGRAIRDVFLAFARMEWERYRDGFAQAKRNATDAGVWIARPPIGYRRDGEGRLEVDPETGPIVRELFELRAAGVSQRKCTDFLSDRLGALSNPNRVRRIIENRAYLGELRYDGGVGKGHEPLVSVAIFEAANALKPNPSGLKRSGVKSMLAGVARCGSCGRKLVHKKRGAGRGSHPVYRCPTTTGRADIPGRCPAPVTIAADALDEYVLAVVRGEAAELGLEDEPLEVVTLDEPIGAARRELDAARVSLQAWAVDSAGMPSDVVRAGLEARQEAVQRDEEALRQLEIIDATAVARTTLRELWSELTPAELRQLFGAIIERVAVARGRGSVAERVRIIWRETPR